MATLDGVGPRSLMLGKGMWTHPVANPFCNGWTFCFVIRIIHRFDHSVPSSFDKERPLWRNGHSVLYRVVRHCCRTGAHHDASARRRGRRLVEPLGPATSGEENVERLAQQVGMPAGRRRGANGDAGDQSKTHPSTHYQYEESERKVIVASPDFLVIDPSFRFASWTE